MKLRKLSLRVRIFFAMILLILIASALIAIVTIYQYNQEAREYHQDRLDRKEEGIKRSIDFALRETTYPVETDKIPLIFKEEIYKIAAVHKLQINFYDLDGELLRTSKASLELDSIPKCLTADVLNALANSSRHNFVNTTKVNEDVYLSSYVYITDLKFKPLFILNIPFLENDEFLNRQLNEFLLRLGFAYIFMVFVAILIAYQLSKYITKSLKTISDKINETRLERRNKKINVHSSSEEIETLVNSYNSMIDELEESARKLATSEREQAWREMAKQVAHEIKNPLTPMRLSVQNFQRKFDIQDPNIHQKVEEYSKTLIQQIDMMSSIASAFSNFAKMPAQQNESLNVVEVSNLALDIFSEDYITFHCDKEEIIATLDRTQLIRVITNLVKNAIQAIPEEQQEKRIDIRVYDNDNTVFITVSDNGIGVSKDYGEKIFEPKFTTKTSGMGLGLGIVKNIVETYKGTVTFTSQTGKGTIFTVSIPKK